VFLHMLKQLTFENYGHTLNRRQSISADSRWAVYDTRNEDSQLARTHAIEMVCIESGEVVRLYSSETQSMHGPGVGAVAYHPIEDKIAFIHGLESCCDKAPYSASRRFGAIMEMNGSQGYVQAESRIVDETISGFGFYGNLSGGTHAHSWNRDGWISFTYNDAILEMESKDKPTTPTLRDMRTVGFMQPKQEWKPIELDGIVSPTVPTPSTWSNSENWLGTYDAFLVASLCNDPKPGSDQIEQAIEECWVGNRRQIAFQGTVRTRSNEAIQEIFLCELPSLASLSASKSAKRANRLCCVPGCIQHRLTHTQDRKYPGIQGPRNWLVASPDGETIYFPMKDDAGTSQVFRVDVLGGEVHQVSCLATPIEGQISINADGSQCAFLSDQRVCLLDVQTGKHRWVTDRVMHEWTGAVQFTNDGQLVGNAYVTNNAGRILQIFVMSPV
jgi:hypothetical protein